MTVPTSKAEALALLTAIGSDKISGQDVRDVVEWSYGLAVATPRAFDQTLDFSGTNYEQTYSAGGVCRVALPPQPWVPGSETTTIITTASSLLCAAGIDIDGTMAATFVAPSVLYCNVVTTTGLIARLVATPVVTQTSPTIVSATVDAADLDSLTVVMSAPSLLTGGLLTGLSLGGSMSVARSIASLVSVSADGLTFVFALSGNLLITDTPTFVVAATTTLYSMNGGEATAGSTNVTMTGGDVAWSPGAGTPTLHLYSTVANLQGASHPTPIVDGGAVAVWVPTIGASNFMATGGARPLYDADGAGAALKPCVAFDGTDDVCTTIMTWGDLVGAGSNAFELIWSGKLDTATATTNGYNAAHPLIADNVGWVGMFFYLSVGGGPAGADEWRAVGYVYSSTAVIAECSLGPVLPKSAVIEMRWLAGTSLIVSVNGVDGTAQTSVGTGGLNAGATAQTIKLGGGAAAVFANSRPRHIMAKSGSATKETATLNLLITDLAS